MNTKTAKVDLFFLYINIELLVTIITYWKEKKMDRIKEAMNR